MHESFTIDRRDGDAAGIVVVTLDRPERLNALTLDLVRDLDAALRSLDSRHDRVVVLTGAGRAFCAGIDLDEGVGERSDSALDDMVGRYDLQQAFARLVATMRAIPQPLVAAVHGPAVGGGLSLAAACDVRIADPTAVFAVAFLRVGLTGGDMGTSYFLPKAIGASAAAELLYTGRDFDAAEALDLRFVSRVTEPGGDIAAAVEVGARIVANSPMGVRLTKEGVNASLSGAPLATALTLENRAQLLCMFTEPFEDAVAAFRDRGRARRADDEGR
ncbi:MAG TPA: enoyl-CoA hydratase-related protein [Acidimicrobiales bacterium]